MDVAGTATFPNWTPSCAPTFFAMIVTVVPTFPEVGLMETIDGAEEGGVEGGTLGGTDGGTLGGTEGGTLGGADVLIANCPQSIVFPEVGSKTVTCPLVAPAGTVAVICATPGAGMLIVACAASAPNLTVAFAPTFLA